MNKRIFDPPHVGMTPTTARNFKEQWESFEHLIPKARMAKKGTAFSSVPGPLGWSREIIIDTGDYSFYDENEDFLFKAFYRLVPDIRRENPAIEFK